jgi:hypothetical protein
VKRIFVPIWIGFLMVSLASAVVWAQATAQVSGTARDQSGAVLPGAEITVTQTETGIQTPPSTMRTSE